MHAGMGYIHNLNQQSSLDLYGKLFWTHLGSDSITTNLNGNLRLDSVDSIRARLGGRFNFTATELLKPYVGLAYEYEFDGKANGTHDGDVLRTVDMKGSSGVGEIGLTIFPSQSVPVTLDLGMQGYVGKREGITGSLRLHYRF